MLGAGVVDSGLEQCQGSCRGYGVLQYIIVFSLFVVLISQHTTVPCPCLPLSEPLRVWDPSSVVIHTDSSPCPFRESKVHHLLPMDLDDKSGDKLV
jgi:hypothetical protein